MAFLPVNPLLTKNGSIAALIPNFGEARSKPTSLTKAELTDLYNNFNVVQDDISINIASKLKIGSIFGGEAKYDNRAFYFDAIAYTDKYEKRTSTNKVIHATRWGIGLRIVLNISKIATDFQFNLGSISAAVQLGQARARYEISGIGLGVEGLSIVLDNISPLDDFTFETYDVLRKTIIPELSKYIKDNKSKLKPQPIAVEIVEPISYDTVTTGKSVAYAITKISKKKPLVEALKNAGQNFESEIIKEVYGTIVGKIPVKDKPSDSAVDRARQWLRDLNI